MILVSQTIKTYKKITKDFVHNELFKLTGDSSLSFVSLYPDNTNKLWTFTFVFTKESKTDKVFKEITINDLEILTILGKYFGSPLSQKTVFSFGDCFSDLLFYEVGVM